MRSSVPAVALSPVLPGIGFAAPAGDSANAGDARDFDRVVVTATCSEREIDDVPDSLLMKLVFASSGNRCFLRLAMP